MWVVIMALTFGSVSALCHYLLLPSVVEKARQVNRKRTNELSDRLDRMFMREQTSKVLFMYTFGPFVLAFLLFMLCPPEFKAAGVVLGFMAGLVIPMIAVRSMEQRRRDKFDSQMVDTLMIMSSALKGGLSLVQAMEVVVEEMSEPTNQEFGILLGENKMGIPLDEAFAHLYSRMPSVSLQQVITTILLARETGGNLPVIFNRIVNTIRENRKLRENLNNLTLQGRIQGGVMSILPIVFASIVLSSNPNYFDSMFNTEIGRTLLGACVAMELIGAFLIWKISNFKDF